MTQIPYKAIHQLLFSWYQLNARSLPWRGIGDPYLIWISEVMLQQTRVDTVIPYFNKWTNTFPDVFHLYHATEEEVLRLWEGLGYYSRARNIKKSADILVEQYGGKLPQSPGELKKLPGIGDYIAAAISSIAFNDNVPALEANGIRVVARISDFHEEVNLSKSKSKLANVLGELIKFGHAGEINQAVMDLGSEICISQNPECETCPIKSYCRAFTNNTQNVLPVKKKKKPIPHVTVVAAVILKGSKVLITKRMPNKLLGGLWEFPGGKVEKGETHQQALSRELVEEIGVQAEAGKNLGVYEHAYTHFSVTVYAFFTRIISGKLSKIEVADYQWVDVNSLSNFPMGKVDRQISKDLQAEMRIDHHI